MKKMICLIMLASLFALGGCNGKWMPPVETDFDNTFVVDSTFDDTWESVIQIFADNQWQIDVMEKDSGIIQTEVMNPSTLYGVDCGTTTGNASTYCDYLKFNVFVKQLATKVTVTINVRAKGGGVLIGMLGDNVLTDCVSTGEIETDFYTKMLEILEQ